MEYLEQIPAIKLIFFQATFVLATSVLIRNISAVTNPSLMKLLKVASWEHLEKVPTIKLTFVQATFVLATSVHIRNISAVTDPILMKL